MAKLEVKDNKKLVLKSVICKKLHDTKVEDVDQEINKFHQHLQLLKAQIFGPLIVKSCGTTIHDDGLITTDFEFYIQAHNAQQYSNIYDVQDSISVPYCLYVRFEDSPGIYSMRILNWIYMSMKMIFKRMGLSIQFMLILLLKKW